MKLRIFTEPQQGASYDDLLRVARAADEFGYDAFFLSRTGASVPRGRPVFPGVGHDRTPEDVLKMHGLVLRGSRVLDPATNTVLEEWGPKG